MPKTDQSILVAASPAEVFDFVADYRNIIRFQPHFSRVHPVDGPSYGLGMTIDARGKFHGVPIRARLKVVEFDRYRRIVSRSVSGLKSLLEWDFSEEDGGTRARLFASYDWPLPLIPKHIKASIQSEIEEMNADSLRAVKRMVETGNGKLSDRENTE